MFNLKFGISSEDISFLFCPSVLLFFGRIPLYFLKEWTSSQRRQDFFGRFCQMSFQLPMIWNKKGIWLYLSIHLGVPPLFLIILSQALTFQRFPAGLKETLSQCVHFSPSLWHTVRLYVRCQTKSFNDFMWTFTLSWWNQYYLLLYSSLANLFHRIAVWITALTWDSRNYSSQKITN